jgi:hypothetical protein
MAGSVKGGHPCFLRAACAMRSHYYALTSFPLCLFKHPRRSEQTNERTTEWVMNQIQSTHMNHTNEMNDSGMTAAQLGPEEEAVKKAIMKEFAEVRREGRGRCNCNCTIGCHGVECVGVSV